MDPEELADLVARQHDTVEAITLIVKELAPCMPPHVALGYATEAARRASSAPPRERYETALSYAAAGDSVVLVALCVAIVRHRSGRGDASLQGRAAAIALPVLQYAPAEDRVALLAVRCAREVARLAARVGDERLRMLECHYAAAVASRCAEAGSPKERLMAVEELRGLLVAYPRDANVRRTFARGTLEHNCARALLQSPGPFETRLAEARELLESALTRRDRRDDPQLRALSLIELATTILLLATTRAGEERVRLLFESVARAKEAEQLVLAHGGRVTPADARRVRRRSSLALAREQRDLVTVAAVGEEIEKDAASHADLRDLSLLMAVRQELGEPKLKDAREIDSALRLLAAATRQSQCMTAPQAVLLADCLLADQRQRVPSRGPLLATLVGLVDPADVGLEVAREVAGAEAAWLLEVPVAGARAEWIGASRIWAHRCLAEVVRPVTERRFLGACLRALAYVELRQQRPSDPVALALLIDSAGAQAYRTDAAFFSYQFGADVPLEKIRDLYRARISLDAYAEQVESVPFPCDEGGGPTATHRVGYVVDGKVRPSQQEPELAVVEERWELDYRWWRLTGEQPQISTPTCSQEELSAWLSTHPTTGILLAAPPDDPSRPATFTLLAAPRGTVQAIDLDSLGDAEVWGALDLVVQFAEPDRYRTASGRIITRAEAATLPERERAALAPDELRHEDIAIADSTLGALLERAAPLGRSIALHAERLGLSSLRVLARGPLAWFPWEGIPLGPEADAELLGERVALVHVPTLASLPRPARSGEGVLAVVGARPDSRGGLGSAARAIARVADRAVWEPRDKDELEAQMRVASVVRFVGHGVHAPVASLMAGLELHDGHGGLPEYRYQAGEARAAQLGSVQRFEAWACEVGGSHDLPGILRGEDEPASFAAALMIAGVQRVVAAPWVQPAGMVALIGGHFARSAETFSAEDDARRLARAKRAARCTMADLQEGREVPDWVEPIVADLLGPVPRWARPDAHLTGPWTHVGWRVLARDKDA